MLKNWFSGCLALLLLSGCYMQEGTMPNNHNTLVPSSTAASPIGESSALLMEPTTVSSAPSAAQQGNGSSAPTEGVSSSASSAKSSLEFSQLALKSGVKAEQSVARGESIKLDVLTDGILSIENLDPGLMADIKNNVLTVTGLQSGSHTVTLRAIGAGKTPATLTVTVLVTLHPKDGFPSGKEFEDLLNAVVYYTNQERVKAGVPPLERYYEIDAAAALRADESASKWGHSRPGGRKYETVIADLGLAYLHIGENLASANYPETAEEVVTRWVKSESHYSALISTNYTGIGVGAHFDGKKYYYCQILIH